jgi:transposase-like protein
LGFEVAVLLVDGGPGGGDEGRLEPGAALSDACGAALAGAFVVARVQTCPRITSIAAKLGCTAETLRKWVRQSERDAGDRPGLPSSERERLKELERENRELKRANEILRCAATRDDGHLSLVLNWTEELKQVPPAARSLMRGRAQEHTIR